MLFFIVLLLLHFILIYLTQSASSPNITGECSTTPLRSTYDRTVDTTLSYNTVDVERQKRLNSWLLSLYDRQACINDSMAIVVYTQFHGGGFGNAIRGLCTSMLLVALFDSAFKSLLVWVK